MNSLLSHRPLSQLFLTAASLLAVLAIAQPADATPCPGADPCPWTQVDTFGHVGGGEFRMPSGVGVDGSGNLYVLERDTTRVQKLDANGGFLAQWGGEGGAEGKFSMPTDIAVDAAGGGVYITDTGNNRIEKFDTSGNFVSAWGWGVADGSAAYQICTANCRAGILGSGSGQFNAPLGIATDGVNVYVADAYNKRIQKFDLGGAIAGQWTIPSTQMPERLALAAGKVYVTTRANAVWRFDTNGVPDISWDGDGVTGSSGAGAGQLSGPRGIAVDASGVYVADGNNNRVAKFDLGGGFTTMWGWGVADGGDAFQTCSANCQAATPGSGAGQLNVPTGILATGGAVWVTDSLNHRLQSFGQGGAHQLTLGAPPDVGDFYFPTDVTTTSSGEVYVADRNAHDIQRLDGSGNPIARWDTGLSFPFSVTPTANGVYSPEGNHVSLYDSMGALLNQFGSMGSGQGQLSSPTGSAVDADGNLYIAERFNDRVQKFDPTGAPLAVFGSSGSGDGQLKGPQDVAIDAAGNVYVADSVNNRIEKFGPAGAFLSKWGSFGSGDGQFTAPAGVAVDADGHVFVSDTYNNRIQQFDTDGNFVAKWGTHGDGSGQLSRPYGLSVDSAGALWVADQSNHRIVRFCCPAAHQSSGQDAGAPPSAPPPAPGGIMRTTGSAGVGTAADTTAPRITVSGHPVQRRRIVGRRGLALRIATGERAMFKLRAVLSRRDTRRLGLRNAQVARSTVELTAPGTRGLRLRLTARARRALLRTRKVRIVVRASAADPAGNRSSASLAICVTG
jgi:DNA-binding beta-propeller fold protein YncE